MSECISVSPTHSPTYAELSAELGAAYDACEAHPGEAEENRVSAARAAFDEFVHKQVDRPRAEDRGQALASVKDFLEGCLGRKLIFDNDDPIPGRLVAVAERVRMPMPEGLCRWLQYFHDQLRDRRVPLRSPGIFAKAAEDGDMLTWMAEHADYVDQLRQRLYRDFVERESARLRAQAQPATTLTPKKSGNPEKPEHAEHATSQATADHREDDARLHTGTGS